MVDGEQRVRQRCATEFAPVGIVKELEVKFLLNFANRLRAFGGMSVFSGSIAGSFIIFMHRRDVRRLPLHYISYTSMKTILFIRTAKRSEAI